MDPKTGEILTFDNEEELAKAKKERQLIELTGIPKKSCNKCHGRGHTGYDTVKKIYIVCPCIDKERQKEIRERREKAFLDEIAEAIDDTEVDDILKHTDSF